MNDIRTIYHGETIIYDESAEQWLWHPTGGNSVISKSLKSIKGKINTAQKDIFVGCTAYNTEYSRLPVVVEVLSEVEDNGDGTEPCYWVQEKEKGSARRQACISTLYAFNAHNRSIVAKWAEAEEAFKAKEDVHRAQIRSWYDQLDTFTPPDAPKL